MIRLYFDQDSERIKGMTVNDPRLNDPQRPKAAPIQFAGKWVAWNTERTEIVADGDDVATVRAEAIEAGHPLPLMEKVPRACSFIGCS